MNILEKYWKFLMWITIVFLIFSVGIVLSNILTKGSFMEKDIDLSGGKLITFEVDDVDVSKVVDAVPYASVRFVSGVGKTLIVEIPFEKNETEVIDLVRSVVSFHGEPSIRIVGPSIGEVFFQQAQLAIIAAFILMAITVFIIFRSIVPSITVILAAVTDIVGTIAVLSLINVPLSLPVLGALLTLIGYSVDTDILLTNELVKSGRTDYKSSVRRAMKTGITMTFTSLIALTTMYFVSGAFVIEQISFVLIIGLLIDIPATWLTNAGVLRMWMEKRSVHK